MTRYDNQLDSTDPGLYASEPPEMGDDDSLVASLMAADAYEQERVEDEGYWERTRFFDWDIQGEAA